MSKLVATSEIFERGQKVLIQRKICEKPQNQCMKSRNPGKGASTPAAPSPEDTYKFIVTKKI
jgi:hypothetical protein